MLVALYMRSGICIMSLRFNSSRVGVLLYEIMITRQRQGDVRMVF